MNAWLTTFEGFVQSIVDAPGWVVLVLKITAILMAAWLVHLALMGANPRWRVLLWRVTAVGLIALPPVAWLLPAINIRVGQAAAATQAVDIPTPAPVLAADRDVGTLPQADSRATCRTDRRYTDYRYGPMGRRMKSAPHHCRSLKPTFPHPGSRPHHGIPGDSSPSGWPLSGFLPAAYALDTAGFGVWPAAPSNRRNGFATECLRVAQAVDCRVGVEVLQSTAVQSPLLCGLRRQRLLLPAAMCEDAYRADLPAIFAHELAHVRSRDVLWNLGLHLISVALWFHPFAWRMRRAHLAACELVSDAVSASFVGDVTEYCRTLARVAVHAYASIPATGIAMARRSSISRRLGALKRKVFSLPLHRRSAIGFGLAALLTVAVLGVLQFALAAPPPAEPAAAWQSRDEDCGERGKTCH